MRHGTSASRLDFASELVLIGLIVGTPLLFGSVELWATELMKGGILLFVLLRMAARRAHGHRALSRRLLQAGGFLLPAVLFLALSGFQALPLPAGVIRLLAPATDALYGKVVPGYPGEADFGGVEASLVPGAGGVPFAAAGGPVSAPAGRSFRTISLYPAGTRERIGLLLAYLALFFAAVDYCSDESRRLRLALTVSLTGFAVAAFAILQKLTWNGKMFWFHELRGRGEPFGPFVNPNHFAGYMELVLPVSLGLLLTVWRHRSSRPAPEDRQAPAAAGVVRFPRLEENKKSLFAGWGEAAVPKTLLALCALAVSVIAILLSGSRGGLIATMITFTLFAGLLVPSSVRRRALLLTVLCGGGIALAAVLAFTGVGPFGGALRQVESAGAEPTFATRWVNWIAMQPLIRDHLLLGTGLGTFRQAYARYYPPGVVGTWLQAHNDYLQVLIETGLLGGLLAAWAVAAYARRALLPALKPAGQRELRIGLAMGLVSIALHSLVDFNLQIPANGFLTVLLGAALAAAVPGFRGRRQEDAHGSHKDPAGEPAKPDSAPDRRRGPRERSGPGRLRPALLAITGLAACACAVGGVRRFAGDRLRLSADTSLDARQFELARLRLESAARWDPARSELSRRLGDLLLEMGDDVPSGAANAAQVRGGLVRGALEAYLRALDASPAEAWNWSGVSSAYAALSLDESRERVPDLSRFNTGVPDRTATSTGTAEPATARDLALAAIDRAIALEPFNFDYLDDRAQLLFDAGRAPEALETIRRSAGAVPVIARHGWVGAQYWSPEMTGAVRDGLHDALASNRLTPPYEIWRNLGDIAIARSENDECLEAYRQAALLAPDKQMERNYLYYQGVCLQLAGRLDEAGEALREAAREPIVEAQARTQLSRILLSRGDEDSALAELRKAVALRPDDAGIRLELAQAAVRSGKPEIALDALESAARLDPRNPEALRQMAELYRQQGDIRSALDAAQRLVDGWPNEASFRRLLDSLEAPAPEASGG